MFKVKELLSGRSLNQHNIHDIKGLILKQKHRLLFKSIKPKSDISKKSAGTTSSTDTTAKTASTTKPVTTRPLKPASNVIPQSKSTPEITRTQQNGKSHHGNQDAEERTRKKEILNEIGDCDEKQTNIPERNNNDNDSIGSVNGNGNGNVKWDLKLDKMMSCRIENESFDLFSYYQATGKIDFDANCIFAQVIDKRKSNIDKNNDNGKHNRKNKHRKNKNKNKSKNSESNTVIIRKTPRMCPRNDRIVTRGCKDMRNF